MKQKKKKDDSAGPSAAAMTTDEQQQLCNGGEPRPKKSALKRTATGGSTKSGKSGKNKRHVQFNESLNVFFESDYVIVIRDDDCDFDEEDFDFWSQQPCSCGDASCFQPWLDDDRDNGRGLPPLDPYEETPATLSPPDGYKDGCLRHVPSLDRHKYADDDLTTRYDSDVTDRCSDIHVAIPYNSASYFEDNNQKPCPELSSPSRSNTEEELLQQQPQQQLSSNAAVQSKPNIVCDTNNSASGTVAAQQPRCIVETITMTTVTERQIVQETRPVDVPATIAEEPKATGTVAADDGYVMIKCGNNTVLYNNRNPNSAVRQLFPTTKFVCPPTRIKETDDARLLNKYLITEESLRAFDSRSLNGSSGGAGGAGAFKSSAEQHSDDDDDDASANSLIRRTIERSTLRRNTSAKKKNNETKEISLIEKIRRLTCDSDEDATTEDAKKVASQEQAQSSGYTVLVQCESVQPAPAYKKLTELFGGGGSARYESQPTDVKPDALDLCDGYTSRTQTRSTAAVGKPFLSTLATACVTSNAHPAVTAAAGTAQLSQCPQPDVVAGTQTPTSSSHRSGGGQEELAAFVQQDSNRLEKIRKRYMPPVATVANDEDDENDDYGFNRRPEVHGIRSGFSAQITIKNHPQRPPLRPTSYNYGPPPRPPDSMVAQPDFVPCRYPMRVQGGLERAPPPPYPAAAQRSIIRVTHGQQQTIRVPYQAVGPVQVHLLTTTAAANVAAGHPVAVRGHHPPPGEYVVQHGHARIHHGQQFVIARGTQTAAISTTRYYQLPPPPSLNSQQHPLPLPPQQAAPVAFQPANDGGGQLQFKQTSPTRVMAARQSQEFADHNMPSVSQPPKNPLVFYGMNV